MDLHDSQRNRNTPEKKPSGADDADSEHSDTWSSTESSRNGQKHDVTKTTSSSTDTETKLPLSPEPPTQAYPSPVPTLCPSCHVTEVKSIDIQNTIIALKDDLSKVKRNLHLCKADRRQLKADKLDLLKQIQGLYALLDTKEKDIAALAQDYQHRLRQAENRIHQLQSEKDRMAHENMTTSNELQEITSRFISIRGKSDRQQLLISQLQSQLQLSLSSSQISRRGRDRSDRAAGAIVSRKDVLDSSSDDDSSDVDDDIHSSSNDASPIRQSSDFYQRQNRAKDDDLPAYHEVVHPTPVRLTSSDPMQPSSNHSSCPSSTHSSRGDLSRSTSCRDSPLLEQHRKRLLNEPAPNTPPRRNLSRGFPSPLAQNYSPSLNHYQPPPQIPETSILSDAISSPHQASFSSHQLLMNLSGSNNDSNFLLSRNGNRVSREERMVRSRSLMVAPSSGFPTSLLETARSQLSPTSHNPNSAGPVRQLHISQSAALLPSKPPLVTSESVSHLSNKNSPGPITMETRPSHQKRSSLAKLFNLGKPKNRNSVIGGISPRQGDKNCHEKDAPAVLATPKPIPKQINLLNASNYDRKIKLLHQLKTMKIDDWSGDHVLAWLEVGLGLPNYGQACIQNIKNGKILLALNDTDLTRSLGISHPIHRLKLRLAVEEFRSPQMVQYGNAGNLDTDWIAHKWLYDLGLGQYAPQFEMASVDGRVLNCLDRKEMQKSLGVKRKSHQLSLLQGIHLLREIGFSREVLINRRAENKSEETEFPQIPDLAFWTNGRLQQFIKDLQLNDFALNLCDSGMHGALMVYDASFTPESFIQALKLPSSRQHLKQHVLQNLEFLLNSARAQIQNKSFSLSSGMEIKRLSNSPRSNNNITKSPLARLSGAFNRSSTVPPNSHLESSPNHGRFHGLRNSFGKAFGKKNRKHSTISGAQRTSSLEFIPGTVV